MLGWGVLQCGILESVWFWIGDLPMYTFLVPTHPDFKDAVFTKNTSGFPLLNLVTGYKSCERTNKEKTLTGTEDCG